MHRENYMNALREDIVDTITTHLTPMAQRYGYSDIPLETNVKWCWSSAIIHPANLP